MKKTFTSSFLGLAISGLLLASCSQMASYENEDLALEQARADKAGFTLSPFGSTGGENAYILEEYVDCESVCIDEDGTYFYVQTAEDYQNGESVTIVTYNTLTEIVYEFSSTTDLVSIAIDGGDLEPANGETIYTAERRFPLAAGWSACDLIDRSFTVRRTEARGGGAGVSVDLETSYNLVGICTTTDLVESTVEPLCIDDEYTITATVTSSGAFMGGIIQILDESNTVVASAEVTETIHSVDYLVPTGSAGTYSFTAQYLGAGSNGYNDSASEPINVEVIDCGGCDEESFSYVATVAGTDLVNIVFSYDAAEPLVNAEVKFTFPQIQDVSVGGIYSAPDGKTYTVNNNGNNTVFTWIGDIIGCTNETAETFEFEVMADCNSSDKAQIWTSASVNDVVVKNEETPNIRFFCTTQEIEESNED